MQIARVLTSGRTVAVNIAEGFQSEGRPSTVAAVVGAPRCARLVRRIRPRIARRSSRRSGSDRLGVRGGDVRLRAVHRDLPRVAAVAGRRGRTDPSRRDGLRSEPVTQSLPHLRGKVTCVVPGRGVEIVVGHFFLTVVT
jgi:hypothetical protein